MPDENPYRNETKVNTSTEWLQDQTLFEMDLDGMSQFARNLYAIKDNLSSHESYLEPLARMPESAWDMMTLPEIAQARLSMGANYAELREYLVNLGWALENTGMAAQTIADLHASTDGWSAATLNSVRWAFAQEGATRPASLPPWLRSAKTFSARLAQSQGQGQGQGAALSTLSWGDASQTRLPDGTVVERATADGGWVQEIATKPTSEGKVVTATFRLDGKVISQTIETTVTKVDGNTTTTTVTTENDGKPSGETARVETVNETGQVRSETTTRTDGARNMIGSTSVVTEDDGRQTITTRTYGDEPTIRTIKIGQQTEGAGRGAIDPALQDVIDIQDQQRERNGVRVIAPDPLGTPAPETREL